MIHRSAFVNQQMLQRLFNNVQQCYKNVGQFTYGLNVRQLSNSRNKGHLILPEETKNTGGPTSHLLYSLFPPCSLPIRKFTNQL